jgi:oligopeptide transport system substrate-binding protein
MRKIAFTLAAAALLFTGCACPSLTVTPSGGSDNLDLYGIDPYTLDPALAGDASSNGYIIQIFSGLVTLDASLAPVPDIAESWDVSPDGLSYTFHLRRDVHFHDGRQVKAADFKYSWERATSPATGSQTAATYLGDIAGVVDVLSGRGSSISGVEVEDDYTLKVTLVSPKSYFLAKLSNVTSYVVDRNNVAEGPGWSLNPNGTGPFKLNSWDEGSELVLSRFAGYYGEKARLSRVTFHLWAGVPMNLYETGEIDVADVNSAYYNLVTDPAGVFCQALTVTPQLSLEYLIFDMTRPPLGDLNVRRALAMSVDKTKLAALMFKDTVVPAEGVLPPGMPGFNEFVLGQPFDIAAAKGYLAASRYAGNMPPITLTTSGYGGQIPRYLEAIISDWRQYLGIEVEVRQLEPEEYLYNAGAEKDNLLSWGWNADYAHPQNFLDVLFGASAEYNIGGYNSAAFNTLLAEAGSQQDMSKSLALYQQAEQILMNDAACIPLWFEESYTLIKPNVRGYQPSPLGLVKLNTVWLDN